MIEVFYEALIRTNSIFSRYFRRLIGSSTIADNLEEVVRLSLDSTLTSISDKYSVSGNYQIPFSIRNQYSRCIAAASTTFLSSLSSQVSNRNLKFEIKKYFTSSEVSEELSKLLEPGVEQFDAEKLTDLFFEITDSDVTDRFEREHLFKSWVDFQKAFSFASRGMPQLREFIRASYEEGSFYALTDIRDLIDKMKTDAENISEQEDMLGQSMEDYKGELIDYKKWAKEFSQTSTEGSK